MNRRSILAGLAASAGALVLSACAKVAESKVGAKLIASADDWHRHAQRLVGGRAALAPEFAKSDVSPYFRGNGSLTVAGDAYQAALASGFPDWKLAVTGLVENPLELSLADLKALPQRTQITRHDCVEGWSAIGEWTGPQLARVLEMAKVRPQANFVVFHCADTLSDARYYESVDMVDAFHPQTIVAHSLNGAPLPERNGAPLRVRIERQLGYKQAKYLTAIELVASLDAIGGGKGGYWEDRSGYQWYAGI
ncbi:MAG: molybdopterin-dependent oxidoreductase [Sphingomonadales bacterium]|nr:molybdopterin-dependent oxidoreductase [Sphingomonadales bacterium]MBD3774884.1 molybdopterin-dependent oxidoreductase [Paracoccaceae bacterium]